MSLEENTTLIREKIASAGGLDKVVKIDFEGDGVILIDGTASPAVVSNEDKDADVTMIISEENFDGLMDGSLNPQMAFMMGKLKIEGDMGLALKLGEIFS
ncbi:SCP2 sterol-binding domain-containing protein [Emcibacter sp.]|uniref:SCP2 sterol-binding domain-containing protein n=1 Tax=Emcibacter sp. TaxID=1979954 RepID=UPI003A94CF80